MENTNSQENKSNPLAGMSSEDLANLIKLAEAAQIELASRDTAQSPEQSVAQEVQTEIPKQDVEAQPTVQRAETMETTENTEMTPYQMGEARYNKFKESAKERSEHTKANIRGIGLKIGSFFKKGKEFGGKMFDSAMATMFSTPDAIDLGMQNLDAKGAAAAEFIDQKIEGAGTFIKETAVDVKETALDTVELGRELVKQATDWTEKFAQATKEKTMQKCAELAEPIMNRWRMLNQLRLSVSRAYSESMRGIRKDMRVQKDANTDLTLDRLIGAGKITPEIKARYERMRTLRDSGNAIPNQTSLA